MLLRLLLLLCNAIVLLESRVQLWHCCYSRVDFTYFNFPIHIQIQISHSQYNLIIPKIKYPQIDLQRHFFLTTAAIYKYKQWDNSSISSCSKHW